MTHFFLSVRWFFLESVGTAFDGGRRWIGRRFRKYTTEPSVPLGGSTFEGSIQ